MFFLFFSEGSADFDLEALFKEFKNDDDDDYDFNLLYRKNNKKCGILESMKRPTVPTFLQDNQMIDEDDLPISHLVSQHNAESMSLPSTSSLNSSSVLNSSPIATNTLSYDPIFANCCTIQYMKNEGVNNKLCHVEECNGRLSWYCDNKCGQTAAETKVQFCFKSKKTCFSTFHSTIQPHGHFPYFDSEQRLCNAKGCKSRTYVCCGTCKIRLCLSKDNKCFYINPHLDSIK